jgi:hypothetical protein
MRTSRRILLVVCLLVVPVAAGAQAPVDPTGHWEGTVVAAGGEILFQVDMAKNAKGNLIAMYSSPQSTMKGMPLSNVRVDGRAISFELTVGGGARFAGVLDADGKTISGDATAPIGSAPFSMTRTGEAKIDAPTNPAIARELEGTWQGTLALPSQKLRLVLTLANQPDGTATGVLASLDQGGIEFQLGLNQKAAALTLNAPAIGGDFFSGAIAPNGELSGAFSDGRSTIPLTFQRVP